MEVTSEADQDETSMKKRQKLETDCLVKTEVDEEKEAETHIKRGAGILLKPKQEITAKSAAQIVRDQHKK